jgi:acyl-CoA thioester hydrolase
MEPYRRKVRYWDVDANAHVFNTRYLVYVDDALTDFFEGIGLPYQVHEADGFIMVLARTEIDFRSEAVIGETVVTAIQCERVGNTSITFGFETVEEESGRVVTRGKEIYVSVDSETHEPIRVPDQLRAKLSSQ